MDALADAAEYAARAETSQDQYEEHHFEGDPGGATEFTINPALKESGFDMKRMYAYTSALVGDQHAIHNTHALLHFIAVFLADAIGERVTIDLRYRQPTLAEELIEEDGAEIIASTPMKRTEAAKETVSKRQAERPAKRVRGVQPELTAKRARVESQQPPANKQPATRSQSPASEPAVERASVAQHRASRRTKAMRVSKAADGTSTSSQAAVPTTTAPIEQDPEVDTAADPPTPMEAVQEALTQTAPIPGYEESDPATQEPADQDTVDEPAGEATAADEPAAEVTTAEPGPADRDAVEVESATQDTPDEPATQDTAATTAMVSNTPQTLTQRRSPADIIRDMLIQLTSSDNLNRVQDRLAQAEPVRTIPSQNDSANGLQTLKLLPARTPTQDPPPQDDLARGLQCFKHFQLAKLHNEWAYFLKVKSGLEMLRTYESLKAAATKGPVYQALRSWGHARGRLTRGVRVDSLIWEYLISHAGIEDIKRAKQQYQAEMREAKYIEMLIGHLGDAFPLFLRDGWVGQLVRNVRIEDFRKAFGEIAAARPQYLAGFAVVQRRLLGGEDWGVEDESVVALEAMFEGMAEGELQNVRSAFRNWEMGAVLGEASVVE